MRFQVGKWLILNGLARMLNDNLVGCLLIHVDLY